MAIPRENHNKSYMKRFRVKFRRRRQCKTNYPKRIKLVSQYKNKYDTKKFRLVVRKTNRDFVCQIFTSDMTHDNCLASAYAHELRRYGIPVGFNNYAAAYCTGLLLARRVITKLQKDHEGTEEVTGEFFLEDKSDAIRAFLDTGIARCSTGANIFGALKGAVDGGLNVPHNTRRFPGSSFERNDEGIAEWDYDPKLHSDRIFGVHIAEYMKKLRSEDDDKFLKQFRVYEEKKIGPEDIETMYRTAHQKIRENPNLERKPLEKGYFKARDKAVPSKREFKRPHKELRTPKLSKPEKRANALKKMAAIKKANEEQK